MHIVCVLNDPEYRLAAAPCRSAHSKTCSRGIWKWKLIYDNCFCVCVASCVLWRVNADGRRNVRLFYKNEFHPTNRIKNATVLFFGGGQRQRQTGHPRRLTNDDHYYYRRRVSSSQMLQIKKKERKRERDEIYYFNTHTQGQIIFIYFLERANLNLKTKKFGDGERHKNTICKSCTYTRRM